MFESLYHGRCMQSPAQGQKPDLSRYACSLTLPKEARHARPLTHLNAALYEEDILEIFECARGA